ncbi:alpha/beta hydrolase [Pseudooctadecabacter jejudonensis]|uniref:Thermostable monoacylglycerol lipase n=1 Tax=Pseudooctadecabacter jejudonensis TaxID=1391910 RepID=A0A1Y5RPU9_9RHOB|nr:alpha/beta hydrolase [Pseudooctadecabacter jejudonensis]SLN21428.1 Thermostable monoacylglycerol lipase [Pseudooctadecabacter jejudonensis]
MALDLPPLEALDGWLQTREHAEGGVRPRCEKQVVWADGAARTPLAIVYVHGFSATGAEVRPLPDLVAEGLGANLYFARLTGHGQDGAAMGRARLPDWEADVAEAVAIGRALGQQIILMGCSTGCTLITQYLATQGRAEDVAGVVHISPNFGLAHGLVQWVLQLPGIRRWGFLVAGRERSFEPVSPDHAALWTVKYDIQAVYTMADAVRAAVAAPVDAITAPAYFAFCEEDEVVSAARTKSVMRRWGGSVTQDILVKGRNDDAMGHVMAGDVFSPEQTSPLAERILRWARTLD